MKDKPAFKRPKGPWLSFAVILLLIPAVVVFCHRIGGRVYYAASVLMIGLTMVPFFLAFEQGKPQARQIVVLAVLCALAVASRAAFPFLSHFKPMVAIIMLSGMAFGPESGFLVGAISGFASNFIYGQGPWTPWQMFAFGMGGFLAPWLQRFGLISRKPLPMAIAGFFLTLLVVGPLLDTSSVFTMTTELTAASVGAVYLSGIPVNIAHSLATFVTLLLIGAPLLDKLDRVKLKYGMGQSDTAP